MDDNITLNELIKKKNTNQDEKRNIIRERSPRKEYNNKYDRNNDRNQKYNKFNDYNRQTGQQNQYNRYNNKNNNKYKNHGNQRYQYQNQKQYKKDETWYKDLDFKEYATIIQNSLASKRYGLIFLGTNDYEKDFQQIEAQLKKHQSQENDKVSTVMLVSNGWIYVLDSLFQTHKNIENVILYDYNPAMLIVYDLIQKLITISETRQEFITNCFCRTFTNDIDSNDKMLEYLNTPYNNEILENVIQKLDDMDKTKNIKSSTAYREIIFKYAVEKTEMRQLYPLYIYDEKQIFIDGKKMHSTQATDNINSYFTTFYYGILSPFMSDQQYIEFREQKMKCKFSYVLSNIYNILGVGQIKKLKDKEITIYIDGIDDETCFYLKNKREFLFKQLQKQQFKEVNIISTKSGITKITPTEIIRDSEFQTYPYKRELQYGVQEPEEYEKIYRINGRRAQQQLKS